VISAIAVSSRDFPVASMAERPFAQGVLAAQTDSLNLHADVKSDRTLCWAM
jgi:hypothetical protein